MTGKIISSSDKRNELGDYKAEVTVSTLFQDEALLVCPYCFGLMTHRGSTIDHIVTPTQWREDIGGDMGDRYHHESNQIVVCSGCNSSKGTTDLFAWWRVRGRVPPRVYDVLIPILDEIYDRLARSRMTHFAFGTYRTVVQTIFARVVVRLT